MLYTRHWPAKGGSSAPVVDGFEAQVDGRGLRRDLAADGRLGSRWRRTLRQALRGRRDGRAGAGCILGHGSGGLSGPAGGERGAASRYCRQIKEVTPVYLLHNYLHLGLQVLSGRARQSSVTSVHREQPSRFSAAAIGCCGGGKPWATLRLALRDGLWPRV